MEACRACLSTEKLMVPLDQPFVDAYNLLTNLNIALLDAMPQLVCRSCLECVKYCIDFREKCILTETSLQEIVLKKLKSESKIKREDLFSSKVKQEHVETLEDFENTDDNFQDIDDELFLSCIKQEKDKEVKLSVKCKKVKHKKEKKKKITVQKTVQLKYDEEQFSCGLCERQFSIREELKIHIESHKNSLYCELCSENAYNWPNLVGHRFAHIPKTEQKCHICNKNKLSAIFMEYHYMNEHFDGKKEPLLCKFCNRTYDMPRKLKRHNKRMHPAKPAILICDLCSKSYSTKEQMATHLKTVHGAKKTYVCDTCGFSCRQSGGLLQHKIRKHNPDRVLCKTCKRAFKSPDEFKKHKCSAAQKICPICGKAIKSRYQRHMALHSDARPYKCTRCGASFRGHGALRDHLYRHDDIRRHCCEFCPLKFYTQSVLIKHRRIHTGEKPYVCKVCNKGFTANHNLKVHMKVHGENLVVKREKTESPSSSTLPSLEATKQYV